MKNDAGKESNFFSKLTPALTLPEVKSKKPETYRIQAKNLATLGPNRAGLFARSVADIKLTKLVAGLTQSLYFQLRFSLSPTRPMENLRKIKTFQTQIFQKISSFAGLTKVNYIRGIVLIAALGLLSPHFLFAQDLPSRVGISVDQSVVSFDGDPGETHTFSLTVRNIFSQTEIINLEAEDMIMGDNNQAEPALISEEAKGLKTWIRADNTSLKLAPDESRQIFLTVAIPYDAVVGSHTGAVMVRAFPEITGENFQQVIISGRVGVYVLINVKGEISGKGSIGYFGSPLFTGKKATFQVDYQNQGNIHYVPHGEIRTQNIISRQSGILGVEKHFVFPGKKYSFVEEWEVPSVIGIYKVQADFVDGDGKEHSNQKYVIGSLFVPMLAAILIVIGLTVKIVLKKTKKMSAAKKKK